MDLSGRHVFVTGAAKRVGRFLAEQFLQYPVKLSAHYFQSKDEAKELEALALRQKRKIGIVEADLRDVESIHKAVRAAESANGAVDILIQNAALFERTPALDCTEAQWDRTIDTNLTGAFFFAQACARRMRQQGGVILNIADVYAEKPMKNFSAYCSSKAGLRMLTKSLAKEWAPAIRVNSISPGSVLFADSFTEEQRARATEKTLFKRIGTPLDVFNAVLFLIRNDYVTGFDLKVDGGRSIV